MKLLATTLSICATLSVVSQASPILLSRAVISPPITYPTAASSWWGTTHHNVTWYTAKLPHGQNFTNTALLLARNGALVASNMPGGRGYPLAKNFTLSAGRAAVQVPDAFDGDNFQMVLFADHGNPNDQGSFSDPFSIHNIF